MIFFFRLIARIFVLGFAYVMAVSAGVATLAASILMWRVNYGGVGVASPEEEVIALFFDGVFLTVSGLYILSYAAAPTALLTLVTEAFSLRSVFIHIGLGAVVAFSLLTSAGSEDVEAIPQIELLITLASGFVAGFVYWLIAGRSAGSWRSSAPRLEAT